MFLYEIENKIIDLLVDNSHNRTKTDQFLSLITELKTYYSGFTQDYFKYLLKDHNISTNKITTIKINNLLNNITFRDYSISNTTIDNNNNLVIDHNIINNTGILNKQEYKTITQQNRIYMERTDTDQTYDNTTYKIYSFV